MLAWPSSSRGIRPSTRTGAIHVASAGGAAHTTIIGRSVGAATYGLNVRFEPGGVLRLYLLRNNTALDTTTATWTPGHPLTARLSVTGTNPTQLAASIWPTGDTPPATWQLTATDTTPALQTAGTLTIKSSVSSSSTVATTVLRVDDYVASTDG